MVSTQPLSQQRQPRMGNRRLRAMRFKTVCMTERTRRSTCSTSGLSPNSAAMSIGLSTSVMILLGNGKLIGNNMLNPNGKPNVIGMISLRAKFLPELGKSKTVRQPRAAGQKQLAFLRADGHRRDDGHAGFGRRGHVPCSAAEVDHVLGHARPVCVVIAARKHEDGRTALECLRRILARRPNYPGLPEKFGEGSVEEKVVGQRVERTVVAVLVVVVDREH